MSILNLTQHPASKDQLAAGVTDLFGEQLAELKKLLTFDTLPSENEIHSRAERIANLAMLHDNGKSTKALIGGALWLMAPLAIELQVREIKPLFAFSVRDTEEQKQEDGSVRKINVFRHTGFVPAVLESKEQEKCNRVSCCAP